MPNNTIDNLAIEIVANANTAFAALQKVVDGLDNIKTSLEKLTAAKVTANIITPGAVNRIKQFSDAVNTIDTGKIQAFTASIGALSSTSGTRFYFSEASADGLKRLNETLSGVNLDRLKDFASIDFSNITALANAAQQIRGLAGELSRLEKLTDKAEKAQKKLQTSLEKTKSSAKKSSNTFNHYSGILGKFFASVKRIAYYRMIRAALKAFTQGFAEGIENLYYWSQMVGTSFAPRMDQLATATQYLKNGFASMFSPLIEYAIPILDRLIDRVVDAFNVMQELFAKLTGAATWNKALKYPVTYKDALDDAAGSAKALQNILMDFDEINAINTPKSGSRGSGGDEKDYSAMFQLMQTETGDSPFGKLGTIFEDIAGKVETAFGTVQKFWNFFKGLNFKPIQDSLSGFWDVLSPILDELNQDAAWFEEKVLEPITQFLVEKGIPAVIDTLSIAIDTLWKVFKPLKDGLKTFWDQNGTWIMNLVGDAFLTGLGAIQTVLKTIGDFFADNSDIKSIFESISNIAHLFGESDIVNWLIDLVETLSVDGFVSSIQDMFTAIEPALGILSGILEIISEIWAKDKDERDVSKGLKRLGDGLKDMLLAPFKMVLRALANVLDALGTLSPACEQAAHDIRVFIGDEIEEIDHKTEMATRQTTKYYEEWDEVGNYVSHTGAKISAAQDEWNQQTAQQIQMMKKLGGEVATQSANMTWWYNYCETNGLDPLTGEIIFAGQKEAELAYQAQVASSTAQSAFSTVTNSAAYARSNGLEPIVTVTRNIKTELGGVPGAAKTAFDSLPTANANVVAQIKSQTASLAQYIKNTLGTDIANYAPTAGYTIGSQLKVGIQNGLRNISLNIPATVQITNVSGSTAVARIHGATFDMSMFASGGFPTPGSLFMAGEGGIPELMGTVGGRTAVAGGAEITGIREAIVEQGQREETLLRSLISAVQNKDLSLVANSSTGRWVNKALKAYSGVTG